MRTVKRSRSKGKRGHKNLILRKLNPEENIRARELYEEVFPEDDEQFVDYYFSWKTKDNVIYAAENEEGIQATVHLNPFWVYWNGEVQRMHYIVAVATRKEYRHQGLMRRLLEMAEKDMWEAGEKFTFLMPANENIYRPFGYRYFAWQRRGVLWSGAACSRAEVICRPVKPQEYTALADFVNEELKKEYSVFIWRDVAYYERLCAEQKCQGGEVMVICRSVNTVRFDECHTGGNANDAEKEKRNKKSDEILGTFCTAYEESEEPELICIEEERLDSTKKKAQGSCRTAVLSPVVLREIILDTDCLESAEDALLSYIYSTRPAADETDTELGEENTGSDEADADTDKVYGKVQTAAVACRVEGCQKILTLQNANCKPLLMGKVPGGGIFEAASEMGEIFINEVV